eukprot:scaffold32964_cov48-Attheya_sp.AAC.1
MEEKSKGKVKQTAPTIINPRRHQTIMVYTGVYMDGELPLIIKFADKPDCLRWKVSMDEIREECNRIIAECSDPNNLPANNVQAIRVWLDRVDSIVDAGRPVPPSFLYARNRFVEAIADQ